MRAGLFQQHGDNAGGHEVRHRPGQHGPDAKLREVAAAIRDQGPDAADLHADGAYVGEPAEGEGGDGEGARVEGGFVLSELGKGEELVDDSAGAE